MKSRTRAYYFKSTAQSLNELVLSSELKPLRERYRKLKQIDAILKTLEDCFPTEFVNHIEDIEVVEGYLVEFKVANKTWLNGMRENQSQIVSELQKRHSWIRSMRLTGIK
ncbi:MAG: hypothetical protein CR997_02640 [Acidobacteria bacterium]|nr:MAG: hypothetical protein CR997_02640 [Acidobacteriota bacterium]